MTKPHHTPYLVKPGELRSFGRLANRMSADEQAQLEAELKAFAPVFSNDGLDVAATFGSLPGPLLVELGIGRGDQLLARAKANPQGRFLGCEVFRNGLRFLLRHVQAEGVTNLRLFPEDARTLLDRLPLAGVDVLMILYPDPWPKARHHKRRLVQTDVLTRVATVLKPGGVLHIVTDHDSYAPWVEEKTDAHPAFARLDTATHQPPDGWHTTAYEQKALREGRTPRYYRWRRVVDSAQISAEKKG